MERLVALVDDFARPENLAQVRTNDGRTLREYHLDASLTRLVDARLRRTPASAWNGTPALASFVAADAAEITADTHELPDEMEARSVTLGDRWRVDGASEDLRHAFAASTCDGCHGAEHTVADGAFHVSPLRTGRDRLSSFLADEELARRASVAARLVCAHGS